MNMVGLPPGMIITLSGDTSTLKRLCRSAATASRSGGMPFAARVAVMAVAQRLDRGLDDELRRAEIGLADAEVDDVPALRRERIGAGQHGEGVFLTDAVERRDGLQHWGSLVRFFALFGSISNPFSVGPEPSVNRRQSTPP